jgi:hypothetical protein
MKQLVKIKTYKPCGFQSSFNEETEVSLFGEVYVNPDQISVVESANGGKLFCADGTKVYFVAIGTVDLVTDSEGLAKLGYELVD